MLKSCVAYHWPTTSSLHTQRLLHTNLASQHCELGSAAVAALPISPVRGTVSCEHGITLTHSGQVVAFCLQDVDCVLGRRGYLGV